MLSCAQRTSGTDSFSTRLSSREVRQQSGLAELGILAWMLVWESKSNRDTFACEIKYTWSGEFVAPTRSASVDGAVEEFHELDEGNEAH